MAAIADEQNEFVEEFNAIGDWLLQYDLLLTMAAELPGLTPEERTDELLIRGCTSKLWMVCRYSDGVLRVRIESEALIVGGIAGIIVRLLDGRTPEEIQSADIDFIERTNLKNEISADRFRGMRSLVAQIKEFANQCTPCK